MYYNKIMDNNPKWHVDEMIMALNANIEYLEKEGSENIRIKNGKLFTQLAESYIYEFELEFLQEIELEREIEVRVGSDSGSGKVVSVNDNLIQVEIDSFLGQDIPQAHLIISSLYILKLLRDKLAESKETKSNGSIAEKLFGMQPFSFGSDLEYQLPPRPLKDSIDEYKEAALRLSLGSELSFIWGPPGTGKTELISRIIEALIGKGLSVLLISHTNMATDEALLKTVKFLIDSPEYKLGQIIRIGKIHHQDLLKTDYSRIIPEMAAEAASKPIHDEIGTLQILADQLKIEIDGINEILSDSKSYENYQSLIKSATSQLDKTNQKITELEQFLKDTDDEISITNIKIEKFQNSNRLSQIFSGQSLSKLTDVKTQLLKSRAALEDNIATNERTKNSIIQDIDSLKTKANILNEKIGSIDFSKAEEELSRKNDNHLNLTTQIKELLSQLTNITEHIITEAKVIATTLTKSYSDKLVLSREYDCVIVDEASMAPLPALYFAASIAKQKAIIIGDFFQLPPVTKHKVLKNRGKTEEQYMAEQALVDKWLKGDIFANAGISELIKKGELPDYLRQLKRQYRMHPQIAELINTLVYNKYGNFGLESADITQSNGEGGENGPRVIDVEPLKDFRVGIYNTNSLNIYPGNTDSGSYYNLFHALLAVELAKTAVRNGYETIGIISPFRAQANLITKMVKDEKSFDETLKGIDVDTVHKFQGGEKQLIIFDITTPKSTKLTNDDKEGGDDEKLINVAFSRAKYKCIVIGDIEKIRKNQNESSLLVQYIDFVVKKGYPIIDAGVMVKNYFHSEQTEDWLAKIVNASDIEAEKDDSDIYNQSEFYKTFFSEILKTKQELIIHSPYITRYRTAQLLPIFDFLRKKNVNIFVITRPYFAHKDSMKDDSLAMQREMEKLGVVVLPWGGSIHDKFAIIDRETLWEGSLNILSQNESRERMRRFRGKESSKQMLDFYGIKKNIGEIGNNNLKKCRVCEGPGNWFWTEKGMFGIWTHCLIGGHKEGKPPRTQEDRERKKEENKELRKKAREINYEGVPLCQNTIHGSEKIEMVRRKGRWGKDIWGCPKYPACKFLLPVK